jgi:DtxR family Mn-dependent transcriptional regulator
MTELTPSLEDYLETIWMEGQKDKVVRVKNITRSMNVKTSSVIGALKNLSDRGLVVHEKYGYIELTAKGEQLAKQVYEKHTTLTKFLHEILGIEKEAAEKDACQIEHHVTKKTMEKIIKFIQFIESCPEGIPQWLSNFHFYAKHGVRPEDCSNKARKKRRH